MNSLQAMRVIHIVDNLDTVNMGIWKAAIATSSQLSDMGVISEIWFPDIEHTAILPGINKVPLKVLSINGLKTLMIERKLNRNTDVIVTHGCWRYPTRWASYLKQQGFAWTYTPHGMLEPWPMQNKYLKKKIYFLLMEKRLAFTANVIRAVSSPEKERLSGLFAGRNVLLIPNGVSCAPTFTNLKSGKLLNFVFMSRLHHKKGITPLVKAWLQSSLANDPAFKLQIAGPDEGELSVLQPLIATASNIEYLGMVSGTEKDNLLAGASYFILPSFSEGFPVSLLEAMEKGAIPVITKDCNFNEVFDRQLGYEITTDPHTIKNMLEQLITKDNRAVLDNKYEQCYDYIKANYTIDHIAMLQYDLYASLLHKKVN